MNRVSAQNSRDRKKHYVSDLEKRLKYLEEKVGTKLWFSAFISLSWFFC